MNKQFLVSVSLLFSGIFLSAGDGVVLYTENGFRGKSEVLFQDDANLRNNRIGNDSLNSIELPPGCRVTLYEHKNFKGRQLVLRNSSRNLARTDMGNNRVSSVRIETGGKGRGVPGRPSGGVTLFSGDRYTGPAETFYGDVANLRGSRVGNDAVNSLRVPRGKTVILYEHKNYRGRREAFSYDDPRLADNKMGNNRASSLQIRSAYEDGGNRGHNDRDGSGRGGRDRDRGDYGHGHRDQDRGGRHEEWNAPVTVYNGPRFNGKAMRVIREVRNFKGSHVGNDRISSLRVSEGYAVTVYAGKNFSGTSETFYYDDRNLKDNWIGDNRISSLKVEWVGDRGASCEPRRGR